MRYYVKKFNYYLNIYIYNFYQYFFLLLIDVKLEQNLLFCLHWKGEILKILNISKQLLFHQYGGKIICFIPKKGKLFAEKCVLNMLYKLDISMYCQFFYTSISLMLISMWLFVIWKDLFWARLCAWMYIVISLGKGGGSGGNGR